MADNYEFPDMDAFAVGPAVLVVGDSDKQYFVCSAVRIIMQVNAIPSADVTLGCGYSLRDPKKLQKQSAEDLLARVLNKDPETGTYTEMASCEIYEVPRDEEDIEKAVADGLLLFKGIIVTGTFVYKAGFPTVKQVRLTCMNKAAQSLMLPVSELIMQTGTYLKDYVQNMTTTGTGGTDARLNGIEEAVSRLKNELGYEPKSSTVAERVCAMLSCVMYAACAKSPSDKSSAANKRLKLYYDMLTDALDSEYKVSNQVVEGILNSVDGYDDLFDKYLLDTLRKVYSGTALEALKSAICSDNFMLELVPKFGDDFKIAIKPSSAWSMPEAPPVIKAKQLLMIESAYNPMSALITPDVYMVHCNSVSYDAAGDRSSTTHRLHAQKPGIYGKNKDLCDKLRAAVIGSGAADFGDLIYKAKSYDAPAWILPGIMRLTTGEKKQVTAPDYRVHDAASSSDSKKDSVSSNDGDGDEKIQNILNNVAKALFIYHYGQNDRCTVMLSPALRFGKNTDIGALENKLGEVVCLSTGTGESNSDNMLGAIDGIVYAYTSGESRCSISYYMQLSRLRSQDSTTESLDCPMYKKTKNA